MVGWDGMVVVEWDVVGDLDGIDGRSAAADA
jgi:hypothetical protein